MQRSQARTRGFTLIELLVVIAIIGLLVSLVFAVGRTVLGGARERSTQDTIRILDTALQAYLDSNDGELPVLVADPDDEDKLWPVIDGRNMGDPDKATINSLGFFMLAAQKSQTAKEILDRLPPKSIVQYDADGSGPQPALPTVLDAWGRPVRFVHPGVDGLISGDGTQPVQQVFDQARSTTLMFGPAKPGKQYATPNVRRNFRKGDGANPESADSDGGRTTGQRAYFYSMGEDGLVGFVEGANGATENYNADNVYTMKPSYPRFRTKLATNGVD